MKLLLILSRVFPIKTDSILDRKDPEGLSGTAFRKRRLRRLEPEKEFSQRILPHWSMFAAGWLPGAIIAWLAVRGDMLSDPLTTALIAYCFTFPIIFTWFCNIRRVRSYRELEWAWTFLLLNIISMLVWGSPAWKIILILSGAHALWAGARAAKDPEVALLSAGIYLKQKCWSRALLESHRCKNLPEGRLALAACYAGFGRNYDARTILQRILTTSRRQEQARQTFPWISRFLMTPLYLTPTDTEGTLMRKRFRGVMLGLACGDALGAPAEFMTREEIRERFDVLKDMSGGGSIGWAPGEYTDDTQMALCLADSLIARGGLDSTDLALRFVEWAESFPPDIGNQTKAALSHVRPLIKQGKDPLEAGRIVWEKAGRRNAGNGGIMRCAPAALAFSNEPEKADRAAELSCFLTHADPRCTASSIVLCRAIRMLLSGSTLPEPGDLACGIKTLCPETAEAISLIPSLTERTLNTTGYTLHTLQAALWIYYSGAGVEEGIIRAVNLGDDADSTGAVTGALLGARDGEDSLPARWLDVLFDADLIRARADALYDMAQGRQR